MSQVNSVVGFHLFQLFLKSFRPKLFHSWFICLANKAVHIDIFGDLTTDSFIAAFHRFSARRGAPRHIYSDNGTNFVGARRKLDEIRKLWTSLPTIMKPSPTTYPNLQ
ncbi:hypothetical protein TNIN_312251 [Trichonephila inaurata madagascariensis]|uniref:Integrase catalytic domain-containing protein n=1 Tax=Trichonephila inaurata madagascariensis TaxID=2747483 RepID=A0A8X6II52_9ARAC|nr:hypothetical protein TNIN_312251 [Trichonephila inaurata madagascariensis]